MTDPSAAEAFDDRASTGAPELEVVIEVPRGSFLKRSMTGQIHFVSPLPCPYNYGAVPTHLGLERDLLDAIVLGPRLRFGTRLRVKAWGAITLTDRGMSDDKLICSAYPPSAAERRALLHFFQFYALCKALRNSLKRRPGRNACEGWGDAAGAIARARPLVDAVWTDPHVPYSSASLRRYPGPSTDDSIAPGDNIPGVCWIATPRASSHKPSRSYRKILRRRRTVGRCLSKECLGVRAERAAGRTAL